MTRYVAFLRAINVGGHVVKMDRLRTLFEQLELAKVETFIASGNVIFDSRAGGSALEARIESHLERALGYTVATFIRPVDALAGIMSSHPYGDQRESAHGLYVGFLKSAPAAAQRTQLARLQSADHSFHLDDRQLYWLSQISTADSRISGATLEKALGGPATLRNITSLEKLAKKVGVTA